VGGEWHRSAARVPKSVGARCLEVTAKEPILGNILDGDIARRPTDTRGRRNSANGFNPVYLVCDSTADLPNVQQRDVLSRAVAGYVR